MRGSHDKTAPAALTGWLAREVPELRTYSAMQREVRQAIIKALRQAQRGLCVYCGRRLPCGSPRKFHIEHFRPRSKYKNLEVCFANLFLSCGPETKVGNASATCGHAKGGRFYEMECIEPAYPACTRRFRFLLTGKIIPRSEDDVAAKAMIDLLNLNHPELTKDREDILEGIDRGSLDLSDFVDPVSGKAWSYAHVACEHLGTVIS